jgi:hypothetical protein
MVHRRAYPQQYSIAEPALSERQLDALAHVISTLAPIYTVNYRSARFHQLDEASFEGGMFRAAPAKSPSATAAPRSATWRRGSKACWSWRGSSARSRRSATPTR